MSSTRIALPGVIVALLATAFMASAALGAREGADYIVVFKRSVSDPAAVVATQQRRHGGDVSHVFSHTIKGYSARLTGRAVRALRRDPTVAYVERDRIASIAKPGGSKPPGGGSTAGVGSWGLDRIDQRNLPLSGTYGTTASIGQGVRAYVLDTGVRISHREFGGRATYGWDFVSGDGDASDCHGHGTHVAGTIGGQSFGVARGVRIVAVRVLDCAGYGTWSGIVAGLDWAVGDAQANGWPAVANLSIGGPSSAAMDQAVARATQAGMNVVVAAGNSSADACTSSPAGASSAITVGATTSTDARASYSNWGSCVDLFAPGSSITSAWRTRDNATKTISGTSMAAPHVAGVVALYLEDHASASPAQVTSALEGNATANRLSGVVSGSPNLLLYTDY